MTKRITLALIAALTGVAGIAAAQSPAPLTQVASFPHQVTGVTVSETGRVFVNFPRWTEDAPVSVAEVLPGGRLVPYPNAEWNAWRNAKANQMSVGDHFVCVQSVVADGRGGLWVLDPGAPGNEKVLKGAPKLVRIDLASNAVTKVISFGEDVALQGSYLNDIRFAPDGSRAYITDSGARGAIVVVDLDAGTAFRTLDGHPSTQVDRTVTVMIDGMPLRRPDGRQPMFAADGIALSNDGATLYWQALTGKTLYSVPTARLTQAGNAAAAVKAEGMSTVADGLWMSKAGALYVTSPQDYAVKRWNGRALSPVVSDRRLRWPDTMAEGPDGTLYVTASHIQDTMWFKPGAPPAITTQLYSFKPAR